eukprot:g16652.t1
MDSYGPEQLEHFAHLAAYDRHFHETCHTIFAKNVYNHLAVEEPDGRRSIQRWEALQEKLDSSFLQLLFVPWDIERAGGGTASGRDAVSSRLTSMRGIVEGLGAAFIRVEKGCPASEEFFNQVMKLNNHEDLTSPAETAELGNGSVAKAPVEVADSFDVETFHIFPKDVAKQYKAGAAKSAQMTGALAQAKYYSREWQPSFDRVRNMLDECDKLGEKEKLALQNKNRARRWSEYFEKSSTALLELRKLREAGVQNMDKRAIARRKRIAERMAELRLSDSNCLTRRLVSQFSELMTACASKFVFAKADSVAVAEANLETDKWWPSSSIPAEMIGVMRQMRAAARRGWKLSAADKKKLEELNEVEQQGLAAGKAAEARRAAKTATETERAFEAIEETASKTVMGYQEGDVAFDEEGQLLSAFIEFRQKQKPNPSAAASSNNDSGGAVCDLEEAFKAAERKKLEEKLSATIRAAKKLNTLPGALWESSVAIIKKAGRVVFFSSRASFYGDCAAQSAAEEKTC